MKHANKFLALILALAMVLSLGITAFAAETETVTISKKEGDKHAYNVWQIMTGDFSEYDNGSAKIANAMWGTNANKSGAVDTVDLEAIAAISGTNAEKAAKLAAYVNMQGTPTGKIESSDTSCTVPAGYYLIEDLGDPTDASETHSLYIVQVAESFTIERKAEKPQFEKKVMDTNDSGNTAHDGEWEDTADYDVDDAVPFQLTATLPEDYADYETYKLVFHDKLSDGFDVSSVTITSVKIADVDYADYTKQDCSDCSFSVTIDDVKTANPAAAKGDKVVVEFTAKLTGDAVVYGELGNPNDAYLEYSNNFYDKNDTGKSPWDTVVVFTYTLDVNKVQPGDNEGETKPLGGAQFTLYKFVNNDWVELADTGDATAEKTEFEFKGLDDGKYKLVESVTPVGFNTIADIEFTISAEHGGDVTNLGKLQSLTATSDAATFTSDVTDGSNSGGVLSTDVLNQAGVVLPSTGGIGTTIFYVVGSMMMLAAAVLLITRKKMSAYQD